MIIVTNKTIEPFSLLDINGMAAQAGYALKYRVPLDTDQYPCYVNRRGVGKKAAEPFPCNDAYTFAYAHQLYWKNRAPIVEFANGAIADSNITNATVGHEPITISTASLNQKIKAEEAKSPEAGEQSQVAKDPPAFATQKTQETIIEKRPTEKSDGAGRGTEESEKEKQPIKFKKPISHNLGVLVRTFNEIHSRKGMTEAEN